MIPQFLMCFYSIHVIVEYNQAGSEIICRQIVVPLSTITLAYTSLGSSCPQCVHQIVWSTTINIICLQGQFHDILLNFGVRIGDRKSLTGVHPFLL